MPIRLSPCPVSDCPYNYPHTSLHMNSHIVYYPRAPRPSLTRTWPSTQAGWLDQDLTTDLVQASFSIQLDPWPSLTKNWPSTQQKLNLPRNLARPRTDPRLSLGKTWPGQYSRSRLRRLRVSHRWPTVMAETWKVLEKGFTPCSTLFYDRILSINVSILIRPHSGIG